MEIVKYVKVIVPGLSTKKVLRNKLWHMLMMLAGTKYRHVSIWGLSPGSPPANFAYAWETTQDRSSLVMGSGAEPRPKTVLV